MSEVFVLLELSPSLNVGPYRAPVLYPFGVIHVECLKFLRLLNSPFLSVWARIGLLCVCARSRAHTNGLHECGRLRALTDTCAR